MRSLRALWRLARVLLHVLHGLAIVLLRFPSLDTAGRQARVQWWAGRMLMSIGARLDAAGTPRPGGALLLANHVSWLDILAVHAVCGRARFVAKADVKAWPLLNRLVEAGGTLYLARERKRDALRVVHAMGEALQAGDLVAVFPEGTTNDGQSLLPFHANLLQAAIATAMPVQPVALRYADATHAVSPAVRWVGNVSLVQSLWRVVSAEGLVVRLRFLSPMGTSHADRRALAEHVREEIGAALAAL